MTTSWAINSFEITEFTARLFENLVCLGGDKNLTFQLGFTVFVFVFTVGTYDYLIAHFYIVSASRAQQHGMGLGHMTKTQKSSLNKFIDFFCNYVIFNFLCICIFFKHISF